jgi:hypothetical protein
MKKVIYYSLSSFLAVNMCTAVKVNLTSINKISVSLNFIHNNSTTELLLAESAANEDKDKHITTLLKNFILFCKNICWNNTNIQQEYWLNKRFLKDLNEVLTLAAKRNTKWVQLPPTTIQIWYPAESYCWAGPASFWPCDRRGKHWTVTQ